MCSNCTKLEGSVFKKGPRSDQNWKICRWFITNIFSKLWIASAYMSQYTWCPKLKWFHNYTKTPFSYFVNCRGAGRQTVSFHKTIPSKDGRILREGMVTGIDCTGVWFTVSYHKLSLDVLINTTNYSQICCCIIPTFHQFGKMAPI